MKPESAKLGSARETPLGLNRNHSNICKFTLDDSTYRESVGPNLLSMAENARNHQVRCNHDAAENNGKLIVPNKNNKSARKVLEKLLALD